MKKLFTFILFCLTVCFAVQAMDLQQLVNLNKKWLIEIGDNPAFASPGYDDSKWQEISVPGAWENQGFPGYDGYAWYRLKIYIADLSNYENLYLQLGRIDDVDQVYLNGHLIGETGKYPPQYQTAYDIVRLYKIDKHDIKAGAVNTIAVRVYDEHLGGGIVSGDVGIYRRLDVIDLEIDLSGFWKFSTGDSHEWLANTYDDLHWDTIKVPLVWEKQGYELYDGYAMYRKRVLIPGKLSRIQLVLLLGYISDIDEVFFNGSRIGYTGSFPVGSEPGVCKHSQERAYTIPANLIKYDNENIIVVRVYDNGAQGGIYEGYVGITDSENYSTYHQRKVRN
jgi:hypothetical protein